MSTVAEVRVGVWACSVHYPFPIAHADVHPAHVGSFFATATFFNVTYFGNPSLP